MAIDLHYITDGETVTVGYTGEKLSGVFVATFNRDEESYVVQAKCHQTQWPENKTEFSGKLTYANNSSICTDLSQLLDGKDVISCVEDILFHLDMQWITVE